MKAFFNSGKHIRAVAWLLVFTTVLGLFPGVTMPAFSVDGAEDAPYVMLDGEVVTHVMSLVSLCFVPTFSESRI